MASPRLLIITSDRNGRRVTDTLTGAISPIDELPNIIIGGSGYVVGANIYQDIARLQMAYADVPGWICKVQMVNRTVFRGVRRRSTGYLLPHYFGFRDPNRHRKARYWRCIELTELMAGAPSLTASEVHDLTCQLLEMLAERGVTTWTPSKGGLARRLLKSSEHWTPERVPAPQHINEMARPLMPGNFYSMSVDRMTHFKEAIYLDQISAHHNIAATVPIPDPNGIRARGHHRDLHNGIVRQWAAPGSKQYEYLRNEHVGLFAGLVSIPGSSHDVSHLRPPWARESGTRLVYWYSNEWSELDALGCTVSYVCAAWTAATTDKVVKEYADFALRTLETRTSAKPIIKQTLLAAYGVLATRSDKPTFTAWGGVERGRLGVLTELPQAGTMVERKLKPSPRQPTVVNVIARGIIEAETRRRSLEYARELHAQGHRIISVYVDGIIVEGTTVPIPREGWQVETHLTHLMMLHPNQYEARERVRLPGLSMADDRRRRDARAPHAKKIHTPA